MSAPHAGCILVAASLALVLLPLRVQAQSDWPSTHYGLFISCRSALNIKAAADATAAGLGPSAMPLSMDARAATRDARGGVVSFDGQGVLQPDALLDAKLRVAYRCSGDPANQQVREVSYRVVDENGAPTGMDPSAFVRKLKYLEACREELDGKLAGEANSKGLPPAGTSVRIDPVQSEASTSGNITEMRGRGQIQLAKDYNWVPMTFSCRHDAKKDKVVKASYERVAGTAATELAPDRQVALAECQRAVEQAIQDEAIRRGYRLTLRSGVVVWTKQGAQFTANGGQLGVKGRGEFKLDPSHRQSTPMTYECAYDTAARQILSATFEPEEASRAPSGEIASGRTATLVCESVGSAQRVCAAPIKGSVRIIRQMSKTPCVAYSNWIWSLSGITVWGGCRAEFEFETR